MQARAPLVCVALLWAGCVGDEAHGPPPVEPDWVEQAISSCSSELEAVSVTASASQTGNGPEHVADGDLGTRWSSFGKGSWILVDLGGLKQIEKLYLAWYMGKDRKSTFLVHASPDGSLYTKIFDGKSGGNTSQLAAVTIPTTTARYLRITVNGNTQNDWASITEMQICGSDAGEGSGGSSGTGGSGSGGTSDALWNSDLALSVNTTLPQSTPYPLDKVVLPSHAGDGGPNNHKIQNGSYTLDGDMVRVYLDIYRLQPDITNSELEFYATRSSGTENISTKYGNHGTDGFEFDGEYVFGGYGVSFHQNQVESKVEYWHNEQGPDKSFPLPHPLSAGQLYGYKVAKTNVGNDVVANAWVDYLDGNGWVHVMKDRKWTDADWNPGSVPNGADAAEIEQGVYLGKCMHWWIRANGGGTVQWKDAKIRAL